MPGADVRRFSRNRRGLALNYVNGILSAALFSLGDALLQPMLVLALFVAQLTDSYVAIGSVAVIAAGAWMLGQLIAAQVIHGRQRTLPWATGASVVQIAALALLAFVAYRASGVASSALLRAFFICFTAYSVAAGVANAATVDVLAKSIAGERRGALFAQRAFWGGLLAVLAGFVIYRTLSPHGPLFPRNYALLFIAATAAVTAATYFFARTREPIALSGLTQATFWTGIHHLPTVLADPNYRRFLSFRVVLSLSALADPFIIVYIQRKLDLPFQTIGLYVVALAGARLISAPLWPRLTARFGYRTVLQLSALIRLLAPVLALALPYIVASPLYADRISDDRVKAIAGGAIFAAYGLALGGQLIGNFGYLLAIAPRDARPAYASVTNIILGLTAFAPLVGAALIKRYDFNAVFLAAVLIGLIGVLLSGALTETHAAPRPSAEAWRLRRVRS